MKIDVEKLINQVSRHPEIYNPDHEDFSNDEIRDDIFNTSISKEMSGIKGQILHRKWDQILNKYASFIRKLSNDDSSETVLERFMEWPWTKQMRIFKPYVRKQFQIPEFQAAVQIPEMDPDDLPDVPRSMPPIFELAMRTPEFAPGPTLSTRTPPPRQEFLHPLSVPGAEFSLVASTRPRLAHSTPATAAFRDGGGVPTATTDFTSGTAGGTAAAHHHQVRLTPAFVRNLFAAGPGGGHADDYGRSMFHHIAVAMGLDQPSDGDESTDSDDDCADEETDGDGRSAAKRRRRCRRDETGDATVAGDDGDADVLPDLPRPAEPVAERRTSDFTVQEHVFLAWAKTMSTFTAKRQATIKMQINKIMSDAEFEDLDDEFFAANKPARRPIYTSRL